MTTAAPKPGSAPDRLAPAEAPESTAGDSVADRLANLSRLQARRGDARLAVLAAWACDVHLLESLLWENGLDQAPDPDAQLAAVGEAVASSLVARAETTSVGLTPREVVEVARGALLATFDESVHDLVAGRLAPLEHLDDIPELPAVTDPFTEDDPDVPVSGATEATGGPAVARLEGRTADQLVADLRATAADCMAVADLMATEGEVAGAARLARQADAAAFEAYLTSAAVGAGDTRLATVDLRWALAETLDLPHPDPAAGTSADDVVAAVRARLVGLLGTAERAELSRTFEPLTRG